VSVPRVFNEPFFQSPVRGDPDELLLIAGANLSAGSTVYYQRASATGAPLAWEPPTADFGIAPVVSETELPHNLVVRLPAVMLADEAYSLWVRAPSGHTSEPVSVNDARPLWFSPSVISQSGTIGTLPRELKVVGRNLRPAPGSATEVRLVGSAGVLYRMTAADDGDPQTSIEDHVARVALPVLEPGTYRVEVSRDGSSWIEVAGASLAVTPDPPPRCMVSVAAGPSCRGDDLVDDRECFTAAIGSAAWLGCDVEIPSGTWLLDDTGGVECDQGIVVPAGVGFAGAGSARSRVLRGAHWTCSVVFTLLGRNQIRGIHFDDAYSADRDTRAAMFQLGRRPSDTPPGDPQEIEDIVFWENRFDGTHESIGGGGLPLRRIFIVDNVLHAYRDSIFLDAFYLPREVGAPRFRLEDSIVASNLFLPGDFVDPGEFGGQGAIAAQFGAALRLDVSENVADGRYPAVDSGWRAGFFFHQTNSHEELLISQNAFSCTGDKAGDGEAIAFDFNQNTYAFSVTRDVRSAGSSFVRVTGSLTSPPSGTFDDHWIQVVRGGGVGQSRRIVSHRLVTPTEQEFVVDPPWDSVPAVGSGVLVSKSFWQAYVLDNSIDTRGCTRTNANGRLRAGEITIWAQTSDSVVAGNAQYESDGIVLYGGLHGRSASIAVPTRAHLQYFVDVRNNRIFDEYDYRFDRPELVGSYSGVALRHWTLGGVDEGFVCYGNTISHNTVWHADGASGGGISLARAFWHSETPAHPQISSTIVQRNHVEDLPHVPGEDPGQDRIGLVIADPWVHDTVVFENEIAGCADGDFRDLGEDTTEL
jgi:hypothetical protein